MKKVQKRYLQEQILEDLESKMVFVGGPRQVGKTTLSQSLFGYDSYLNWDNFEDKEKILNGELPPTSVWVFNEIHKYKKWRGYIKGLYDKNKIRGQKILVTGSARLDFYRYSGDSLQGRYHYLRLHPLSFDELNSESWNDFESLFKLGGFPEPFFKGSAIYAQRWSKEYKYRILRDDISTVEKINDLSTAELALSRLPDLVGSPLSINGLCEDLQVSFKTVKRWVEIFERFYAIFKILPFGSPKLKAVKKEQKHYHYDWTLIKSPGLRFENMVASHLIKRIHFIEDTQGREIELRFYRDNEQREVDFVICENSKPLAFIECKYQDHNISSHLKYLKGKFPKVPSFQLCYKLQKDFLSNEGIRVGDAYKLLNEIYKTMD